MSALAYSLIAIPFLMTINAFLIIAETSLVSITNADIERLRASRPRTSTALRRIKRQLSSTLGTIRVCLTMTLLLLGWVGEPAMTKLLLNAVGQSADLPLIRVVSVILSFLTVTLLTVVLSELVPKALSLQHATTMAAAVARPMLAIGYVCRPLVWLMETLAGWVARLAGLRKIEMVAEPVTADELRHIAARAGDSGNLTQREQLLVLNSLALGKRSAMEVMVPSTGVSHLDIRRSMAENLNAMSSYLFSRMPLCDGGLDNVIGVIYTKEFLTAQQETDDSSVLLLIARPPVFAPVTVAIDTLLTRFHDDKTHLICLVDEHGALRGIVTLTDVVSELLGPMHERQDPRLLSKTDSGLIVKGQMPISHVADYVGRPGWGSMIDSVRSVGGLILHELDRVPKDGDSVTVDGVQLIAHKCSARSVEEVRIVLLPPTEKVSSVDDEV